MNLFGDIDGLKSWAEGNKRPIWGVKDIIQNKNSKSPSQSTPSTKADQVLRPQPSSAASFPLPPPPMTTAAAVADAAGELEVITSKSEMRAWSRHHRYHLNKTIALVPTMGYLHAGHLSLVHAARAHADLTVVSIYVNPGQLATTEDLAIYPTDLAGDLKKLKSSGVVDAVFLPSTLYEYVPDSTGGAAAPAGEGEVVSCLEAADDGSGLGHETWIRVERMEKLLCGRTRPIMFRGTVTIVAKLFNIVEPDVAMFGRKDYQQWRIICRMVRDLDIPVKIIDCEITRDFDGIALSSRNVRLSPEEREKALSISKSLARAKLDAENGNKNCKELKDLAYQTISEAGGRIEYVEIVEQESLQTLEEINCPVMMCVAAWFGNCRLIDNVEINLLS